MSAAKELIDILRFCNHDKDASSMVEKSGSAKLVLDKGTGRRVWLISGAIAASNFIRMPLKGSSLDITGSYMYLQLHAVPRKLFSLHVEFNVKSNNGSCEAIRCSLSNMYKCLGSSRVGTSIQVPVQLPNQWVLLCVDLAVLVSAGSASGLASFSLKSLQICSSVRLRGAWLSQSRFDNSVSLPREMQLSLRPHSAETLAWQWLPPGLAEPSPIEAGGPGLDRKSRLPVKSMATPRKPGQKIPVDVSTTATDCLEVTFPEPVLRLTHVIGYTGFRPGGIAWANGGNLLYPSGTILVERAWPPKESQPRQRQLLDHSDDISSLAVSLDGRRAVTGQAGKFPIIRVWDLAQGRVLARLAAHASSLASVALSEDGSRVVAVGSDSHGRVQILLWEVRLQESRPETVESRPGRRSKSPSHRLVARQVSEFPIDRIRFSPYDVARLVSVGRENIRFWRLSLSEEAEPGHLAGCPVILNEYARETHFTDLAFESCYGARPVDGGPARRVFVSSRAGTVVQVNYETRELECVFKLHDGPITCMEMNEGFCVTGSGDCYLRVWPLDFSDYFLEARHEGPITSLAISPNGLQILAGTLAGTVGCLDVSSHCYDTLVRSHVRGILDMAVHTARRQCVTASQDGSIRLWSIGSLASGEQLYEFNVPGDTPTAVALHPDDLTIACGFHSGSVKIFDIHSTSVLHEFNQHRGPVARLIFTPSPGLRLFSAGVDSHICAYDVTDSYSPFKLLASDTPLRRVSLCMSRDGTLLASIGSEGRSVVLFATDDLSPLRKIEAPLRRSGQPGQTWSFHTLCFSGTGDELVVATSHGRLARFSVSSGELLREVNTGHKGPIDVLSINPAGSLIATAGADAAFKIWAYSLKGPGQAPSQAFIGHAGGVSSIAWLEDEEGNGLAVTSGLAHEILVWRVEHESLE